MSWSLQIAKVERSIHDLHRSWRQKVLQLNPDFERKFVWDENRQTKLVESVLARIPLPAFYLSEENEERTIVIDGRQRLTTIFRFLQGDLVLGQLDLMPELNGKRFADLDGKLQRRFEATPLTCFVLQPGTDSAVKFHIFERLNLGGVALNAQETRNGLFQGPGLDMVKRLAADTSPGSFFDVVGLRQSSRRRKEDELILRALAVLDLGPGAYAGSMIQFLNDELLHLNGLSRERLQELALRLHNVLARAKAVFGEHAFRRYNPADKTWTSQMNGSLLEILVFGFDKYFSEGRRFSIGLTGENSAGAAVDTLWSFGPPADQALASAPILDVESTSRRQREIEVPGHGVQYFDMHAKPGGGTRVHVWTALDAGKHVVYVGHCGEHLRLPSGRR